MVFLSRKNGNTGEIKLIVTELDRAEFLATGYRWINIDDVINQFNSDDKIKHIIATAVYAGDLKDNKLSEYIENLNNTTNSAIVENVISKSKDDKKKDDKQKVSANGSNIDEDEEEENDENDELKEFLSEYDLTCKECNEENKALVDAEGNIHPCESCIKIDAYLKGKKEGYEEGYTKGYAECIAHLKKIASDEITVTTPDTKITNDETEKH